MHLQFGRIYIGEMIPVRNFGKTDLKISALGLGGHHLGAAKDEATAVEIVHRALDGGITFYDCCWEYNRGKSEDWLGKGLRGARDRAFLMTKVCTHGRDASLAMQMLEQSLRRLQTDHLDLWQIHGVTFQNDPDLFIRPNGAAEALQKAKQQGKVRFVGFSGHKDPDIHLAMLNTGFPFDAVQMPLNPFDANFFSFEKKVLPVLNARGIAPLGMKPIRRPRRAGAEGCVYRRGVAPLCHELACSHNDLRGFGAADTGTKSTHCGELYPALPCRDESSL
jgi:uncharacterized protein